jgi:hypothetical protein
MHNAWQLKPGLTERLVELQPHNSANEIASILSHEFNITLTRSQVLGKTSRMKLVPRELPTPKYVRPSRARIVAPPLPPPVAPKRSSKSVDSLPIVKVEANCCRFLYGDYPFICCDQPRIDGSSYCISHHQQAHVPPTEYSRRRAS